MSVFWSIRVNSWKLPVDGSVDGQTFRCFMVDFIPSQMALGAGCDWNSSLEGTPYPTCHASMDQTSQNFMENHGNLWFSKTSKPNISQEFTALPHLPQDATRIHDFSVLN